MFPEIRKAAPSESHSSSHSLGNLQLTPLTPIVTQIFKLDTSHFPSNSIQSHVITWAFDHRNFFSQNPQEALLTLENQCLESQTTLCSLLQNGNFFKSLFKIEEVKKTLTCFLDEFTHNELFILNTFRMRLIELAKEAESIQDLKNKYLDAHYISELIPFGEDRESVVSFLDEPKIVRSAYKMLLRIWHHDTLLLKTDAKPHLFENPCSYQELVNYLIKQDYPSDAEFAFYQLEHLCEESGITLMNLMLSEETMKILLENLPWLETALFDLLASFKGNIRTNLARMIFFHWCEFLIRKNQQLKTPLEEKILPYLIQIIIARQFPSDWKYILPPDSSKPEDLIEINEQHKKIYTIFENAYQKKK